MIKKFFFLSLGLGLCFKATLTPVSAADPHLALEPASGSYSAAFEVAVKIDTGGQASGGTDILIEFPAGLLKVNSVDDSESVFPFVYPLLNNSSGQLRITAGFPIDQAGDSFTGSDALVATIIFSPLGDGNTQVNFVCTPGYTLESNILEKVSLQDIIVCGSNVNATYVLSGGTSENSPTPSPTPTGSSSNTTATPTPTSSSGTTATPTLPVTGSPAVTLGLVGISLFALLTGLVLLF